MLGRLMEHLDFGKDEWSLNAVASVSAAVGAVIGVIATVCWNSRRNQRKRYLTGSSSKSAGKKIKVYHARICRSARITCLVAEIEASKDFEFIEFDPYAASEDERQWYRNNVHPHGTIPAMVDDMSGRVLVESGAMCMYLAERYGQLLPSPDTTADYFDWCVYACATVDPSLSRLEIQLKLKQEQSEQRNDVELNSAFACCKLFAQRLDQHLDTRNYICGTRFTAADIVVGYCVMYASVLKGGIIIADYPNVKRYLAMLKARPNFKKTIGTPREWICH